MTSPRVRVVRNGQEQEVDAKALVPGDIILLEAGVQVRRRWPVAQRR